MKQSAAIPFRLNESCEIEVLLITSRTRKRWVLPKGKVPRGMSAFASAAREAREEGGVIGDIAHTSIGSFRATKRGLGSAGAEAQVEAYPLSVWSELETWPEMRLRQRRWLPLNKAIRTVDDRGIRTVLKTFARDASKMIRTSERPSASDRKNAEASGAGRGWS